MGLTCELCKTEFEGESITGLCNPCLELAERGFQKRKRQEETEARIAEGIAMLDLPPNMRSYGFPLSTPDIESENAAAWEFARNWKPTSESIWLWGAPGCGKSFLALSIARRALWNSLTVCHVNARRLVTTLQRFEDGHETIHRWKLARVLILDDIDKLKVSETNVTGLWEVLDARVSNGYPTIVTSNWDPKLLRTTWSEQLHTNPTQVTATLDRLKPCTIIEMKGGSNRGEVTRLTGT